MKTFAALIGATLFAAAAAKTITVSAGEDFEAVCLMEVEPGDTCYLEKGNYNHDGLTRVHGTEDNRITIKGDPEACIKGSNTQDRVLQIAHDYYTIEDICFNGSHGGDEYVATAIYVLGADKKTTKNGVKSSVTGLIMRNLEIKNFDSECVHFRYFVTHAEVEGCTIQNCGKEAFVNGGGGKVGEAIYLGTALDQVDDNKAPEVKLRSGSADNVDADICRDNWIHHNTFRTYGNECVDVKEGSTNNLIEYNICEKQKDANSGGIGFRGSENTARYNEITDCVGAGVRVGGDKGYGEGNHIYGNVISNADYGAFNVMSANQGVICGNEISDVTTVIQGAEKDDFTAADAQASCSSSPGDIDGFSSPSPSPSPDDDGDDDDDDDEDDTGAGVNFSDEVTADGEEIYEINSQDNVGTGGEGDCGTVLKVVAVKVEHAEYADSKTDVENLFDGDLDEYFSVNRESTQITFELEGDMEVNGVSIGFFMKAADEMRIQTFDIAIRSADDDDWTTVISRKESSGDMGIMETFPFTSKTAKYVRFESHGNSFNNWTALTEFEICAEAGYESNSKFSAMKAAKSELQKLSGVSCDVEKLAAVNVKADGSDNLSVLFDGNFETRWSTSNTQNEDDLDNDKIRLRFLGDQFVSYVKISFFDGHLAKPHFSLYKQKAADTTWTNVYDHHIAEKTESFQEFYINQSGVNKLYIVGNGNDVGDYTKISEVEVYGC